jgi:hypothetical protein
MIQRLSRLADRGNGPFWVLFVCTLLVIYGMQISGAPLKNEVAPGGIVSLEFAGTLENSLAILDSWQGDALAWAKINMGLDFLFLTCYGLTIALASILVSKALKTLWPTLSKMGKVVAILALFAAGLDIIENVALLAVISGWQSSMFPVIAKYCAIPKFILVGLSLFYVIVGLGVVGVEKFKGNLGRV